MVQDALYAALESHGYSLGIHVRISRLLDQSEQLADDLKPHERQEQLMNAGNRAREKHGEDHLALLAVTAINGIESAIPVACGRTSELLMSFAL